MLSTEAIPILFVVSLQIDATAPSVNLSTIPELLENGTLALRLQSYDAESGVRTMDVYHLTGIEMKICHSHANVYVYHTQEPLLTQAFSGKLRKFGPYTTDL